MNASTASKGTRVLGALALLGLALLLLFGLVLSPADGVSVAQATDGQRVGQGDYVRIMYVHVPTAIIAFLAFFVTVAGSVAYLVRRSEWWDVMAHASAELGAVLLFATLVTGALWGEPTWGTYWEWDPRLTTTALLLVLFLGYLAVRSAAGERRVRAKRAAVAGLVAFVDVPLVHYSVEWWRSLHQDPTITRLDPTIDGLMLFTLMTGIVVFAGLYVWLVVHRFRVQHLEEELAERGLQEAITERRREAEVGA